MIESLQTKSNEFNFWEEGLGFRKGSEDIRRKACRRADHAVDLSGRFRLVNGSAESI